MVIFHSDCFTRINKNKKKMISVQNCRIAIGCFLGKPQFSSFISKNRKYYIRPGGSRIIVNLNQQEEVLTLPCPSLGCVSGGKQ